MWLNTRLPPCHRPSSVWYCGESATRQAGSQVACTAFVPTIQPTTASSTTHAGSTVAVQAGPAFAAGAAAPAASAAARSAIRRIRRIRDLRSLSFGETPGPASSVAVAFGDAIGLPSDRAGLAEHMRVADTRREGSACRLQRLVGPAGAAERPCQRRVCGVVRPERMIPLGPEHGGIAVALDVGVVLREVVVVLHLAEARRLEVPGQRPLVPGPRLVRLPCAPVQVARGLRQLGPRGAGGDVLAERDRLIE